MKTIKDVLVKRQDRYDLYGSDGSKIASSSPNPFGKLSIKNCDEIFGVVDVEKIIEQTKKTLEDSRISSYDSFKIGFNKAMELNKDKLFTVEDIMKAFEAGYETLESEKTYNEHYDILIQSLQQPKEIEVEIEMVCPQCKDWGYVDECRNNCNKKFLQQKLDENGCLILKKK